jgi:hypothetical protein
MTPAVRQVRAFAPGNEQDRCRHIRGVGLFGVPCAGCARQLRIDAGTCWGCGRAITAEERADEHAGRVRRACGGARGRARVHLAVWIGEAVIDRSTLLDGYIIRVAALAIFAAGLRAALAARRT